MLLSLIIVFVAMIAVIYVVDYAGVPHPFNMIIKVVTVILGVVYILRLAGLLSGTGL